MIKILNQQEIQLIQAKLYEKYEFPLYLDKIFDSK
jgi:hypothetical protein